MLGLTVEYAWEVVEPNSGVISEGLDVLDNIFSYLIYDELPMGTEWLEQLDVLNAIRIKDFSNFKKLEEYYGEKLDGYCCLGIKKDSEDYTKACELLKSINISNILIDNELNKEYVRLAINKKQQISDIKRVILNLKTGRNMEIPLTENEIEKYDNEITIRYAKKRLFTAIDYRDKKMIKEQYMILKDCQENTDEIRALYLRNYYLILKLFYKIKEIFKYGKD